jgi:hypothetical protein
MLRRDHLGDLDIDGRSLKKVLEKEGVMIWAELLIIVTTGGLLWTR